MPPSQRRADSDYLYDKPYEEKGVVRVAGPFTVGEPFTASRPGGR